jgi:cyclic pyranopterin phosphate synthase
VYCTYGQKPDPDKSEVFQEKAETQQLLSSSNLIGIIQRLHAELQLEKVRLTGGEPLLHPRIRSIVSAIREMGISNIGMTTNGHLLQSKAESLREAGLKSVNISLDALSPETFERINGFHGLSKVLKAIDTSLALGLEVKLNMVVIAGKNDHEILPMLNYALDKGIVIRFLELMPMGPLHGNREKFFFSSSAILDKIGTIYSINKLRRKSGETSDYWSIHGKKAFGIIANDSSPFCSDCDRLRLDSYGNIYGCLSSLIPIQIGQSSNQIGLQASLQLAMSHKQSSHFVGNQKTMQSIGG